MARRRRGAGRLVSSPRSDAEATLVAIRRIVRWLRLADREAEHAHGVSVAQLFVLEQLAGTPARSIAELAQRTLTDASSVSTVVARLVERGLIARTGSTTDRRRAELSLTPAGRRTLRRGTRLPQAAIVEAVEAMPARRRAVMVRALEQLVTAIGADAVEPRLFFEDEIKARGRTARRR